MTYPDKIPSVRDRLLLAACLLIAAIIVTTTASNGMDFNVYWGAVRAWLEGGPLYSVERDGIMVFKYPPWIAPLFAPWALLPYQPAKTAWGLLQAACFFVVGRDLVKRSQLPLLPGLGLLAFFYNLFVTHAVNGQVTLVFLAAAWFGLRAESTMARGSAAFVLSAKLVSLFPVLGLGDTRAILRALLRAATGVTLGMGIVWILNAEGARLEAWLAALAPGRDPASGEILIGVQGLEAQGWVSMVFRVLSLDAGHGMLVHALTLGIAATVAAYWHLRSRCLSLDARIAGWVALAGTVLPLAGFHTFVLALPLAWLAMEAALKERGLARVLVLLGVVAVTAVTQRSLGPIGLALQTLSIKSWGVLALTEALARSSSSRLPGALTSRST